MFKLHVDAVLCTRKTYHGHPSDAAQIRRGRRKRLARRRAKRVTVHGHKHESVAIHLVDAALDAPQNAVYACKHALLQRFVDTSLFGFGLKVCDHRANELDNGDDERRKRDRAEMVTHRAPQRSRDRRVGQLTLAVTALLLALDQRSEVPLRHGARNDLTRRGWAGETIAMHENNK